MTPSDSMAHLKTDFYVFIIWALGRNASLIEIKEWSLQKIERDFNSKISFDEIREETRPDYEMLRNLFSR